MAEMYWNIGLNTVSIIAGIWGIWYFLFIPKLRYKVEIFPIIRPTLPLDKLKILFTNKPIKELSIVCISIYNKGMGIADNFVTPITISSNKRILDLQLSKNAMEAKVVKKYKILKDEKSIDLSMNFINRNEEFTCYCIIDGTDNIDISVSGRCKGCSEIKQKYMIPWRVVNKYVPWILLLLFSCFIAISSTLLKNRVNVLYIKLKNINQSISQQVSEIKTIKNNIKTKSEN